MVYESPIPSGGLCLREKSDVGEASLISQPNCHRDCDVDAEPCLSVSQVDIRTMRRTGVTHSGRQYHKRNMP